MKTKVNKTRSTLIGCILAVCCLALIALSPIKFNAEAKSLPNQEPTEYLEQTLQEFGYSPEGEYLIDILYSENLMPNGYEYTFEINNQPCYALMVRELAEDGNVYYDIMELFIDSLSPFQQAVGKKVYIDVFTYICYDDNIFTDLQTNTILTQAQVVTISERGFNYGGYDDYTTEQTTFTYDNKTSSNNEFPYGLPNYSSSSYNNACANIAGGIVLGYYDIFHPEIIPNYDTGYTRSNSWRYYGQSNEITSVIDTLHFDMRTNVNNGTSFSDFKSGLQKYVNRQGKNVNYTSVMTNGSFNYTNYKNQIAQAKPVALFLSTYNITDIVSVGNTEAIDSLYYNINHVMVGSGYQEIDYYKNNALFRSDKYLKISTALQTRKTGYLRFNDRTQINEAIGVNIY